MLLQIYCKPFELKFGQINKANKKKEPLQQYLKQSSHSQLAQKRCKKSSNINWSSSTLLYLTFKVTDTVF